MNFIPLETASSLEDAVTQSRQTPVVLFKHSAACSLSAQAYQELSQLTEDEDPPVYLLVVQRSRSLSNQIEARFGIRHESPQVIVLVAGEPVYDTSHFGVTARAVRTATREEPAV